MMTLGRRAVVDAEDDVSPWRAIRPMLFGVGLLMAAGAATGFVAALLADGGRIGIVGAAVLAVLSGVVILLAWLLRRELRSRPGETPLSGRERLNRGILIGCGLLGGVTGAVMMLAGDGLPKGELFSNGPMPAWAAVVLILLVGVLLPIAAAAWHRNVDEQESAAYRTGALWGLYLYMIGAPLWWFGWRGGLLPAPDGTAIYFATVFTVGAVWMWRKYR